MSDLATDKVPPTRLMEGYRGRSRFHCLEIVLFEELKEVQTGKIPRRGGNYVVQLTRKDLRCASYKAYFTFHTVCCGLLRGEVLNEMVVSILF
jgi:hypothetical protein